MDIWGLTGLMGSGKSFAREILAKNKFPCIDADFEASRLLSPEFDSLSELSLHEKSQFKKDLQAQFSSAIDPSTNEILRPVLLKLVSESQEKRKQLESLTIPLIRKLILKKVKDLQAEQIHRACFIEGTRLAESPLRTELLTGMIFVEASESVRHARVKKRNPTHYKALIELQKSQNELLMKSVSQIVWINETEHSFLETQINDFLKAKGYID